MSFCFGKEAIPPHNVQELILFPHTAITRPRLSASSPRRRERRRIRKLPLDLRELAFLFQALGCAREHLRMPSTDRIIDYSTPHNSLELPDIGADFEFDLFFATVIDDHTRAAAFRAFTESQRDTTVAKAALDEKKKNKKPRVAVQTPGSVPPPLDTELVPDLPHLALQKKACRSCCATELAPQEEGQEQRQRQGREVDLR